MPTTPQDRKPKAADVPDFTYLLPDGETITVPPFRRAMTAGFLRKHRNDAEVDLLFGIIETLLDEDDLDRFDGMNLDELEAFFDAWKLDSKLDLPES